VTLGLRGWDPLKAPSSRPRTLGLAEAITFRRSRLGVTTNFAAHVSDGSKLRKTHWEQMWSGLPLKANIQRNENSSLPRTSPRGRAWTCPL
jgi:hypothetical protein